MMVVNGWQLMAHPLFLDQFEKLGTAVERLREKDPRGWRQSANAKLLSAICQLVFETIPQDPTRPEYRQGGTLGDDRKHWFRAKFGGGRFRLFFRYSTSARIIIFAWVNDETTLRTDESKSDAYAVFRKMLDKGHPPDDWPALLAAANESDEPCAGGEQTDETRCR
ncbi:MAG: type II toxin-antitoxin system YhaV family toxin [Microvirga sp.]